MAGRLKKLTKQSAASSGQPEFTLFVDRSLGKHLVAEALRLAGAAVEIHDDHFPVDARDVESAAAFVAALPANARLARTASPPFIATVSKTGRVSLLPESRRRSRG